MIVSLDDRINKSKLLKVRGALGFVCADDKLETGKQLHPINTLSFK